MTTTPEVSVVMAVYNGEPYLRSSLESVLLQTGVSFELIIVDDGSTDSSSAILDEFAQRDSRVRILRQENCGLTVSLQRGCNAARGQWIARQDADDLSFPDRLARQAALLRSDPQLSLVWSRSKIIGPEGETLFATEHPRDRQQAAQDLREGVSSPCHGSAMFSAAAYRKAGGYRAEFRYAQDWDLWLRLIEVGEVQALPETLYARRVTDVSISAFRSEQQRELAAIAKECAAARQRGESEAKHLDAASVVSQRSPSANGQRRAGSSYFIGKCLFNRRDSRAVSYLRKSIRETPGNWRGWASLAMAKALCQTPGPESTTTVATLRCDSLRFAAGDGDDGVLTADDVTIAIPTFHREEVLINTVRDVLGQSPRAGEILILDQTPEHTPEVTEQLAAWDASGDIRWIRLPKPSIPAAMNQALLLATGSIVLFLDDDLVPEPGLIATHAQNYGDEKIWAVAGQVLQPGQTPQPSNGAVWSRGIWRDMNFPFNSTDPCRISNCMAGNLSVRRQRALELGGFDENYISLAYRFETDFARRLTDAGGEIQFEPRAVIHHLQALRGGTRVYGLHRSTCKPDHAVGEYYFALRHGRGTQMLTFMGYRLYRALVTRHNLFKPWWIPLRLYAELHGLVWAMQLASQGPKFPQQTSAPASIPAVGR